MRSELNRMRIVAAVVVLSGLVLAGCGSSSTTTSAAGSASRQPAPTTAGPTASTTTTRTGTTTTTAAQGTSACTAATLHLSFLGGQGATGHGEIAFSLRNVGTASCHTYGYPGVLFLGKAGTPLPTSSTRTTHDFFGTAPATRLIVGPGESISFRLGVTHFGASTTSCTTAYALQVIPPDDTHALRATIPQGAYECGTTTVSPVRPGSSAYP